MSPSDFTTAGLGRLLRPDQVAAELGCSPRHVYRLISAGCFDILPIGRRLRITRSSFEQWQRRVSQLYAHDHGFGEETVTVAPGDDPRIRRTAALVRK